MNPNQHQAIAEVIAAQFIQADDANQPEVRRAMRELAYDMADKFRMESDRFDDEAKSNFLNAAIPY